MRYKQKVLLAKIETTYGTDAGPTVAANAILASSLDITPINSEEAERDILMPHLGGSASMLYNLNVNISFKCELQGSGTAGDAPLVSPILRMCGLSEVITAGTQVEYMPVSEDFESATLYFFIGTTLHKLTGVRGNIKTELSAGIPYITVEATGLFNDPEKSTQPDNIDWDGWQQPDVVGNGNTSGFTLHGFAAEPHSIEVDLGQSVEFTPSLTKQKIDIGNRSASGSVTIENPELDAKDYFAAAKASQTGTLTVTHGTTAGRIIEISAPKVQLTSPSYTDLDGIAGLQMEMKLLPDAGNDELKFIFK